MDIYVYTRISYTCSYVQSSVCASACLLSARAGRAGAAQGATTIISNNTTPNNSYLYVYTVCNNTPICIHT